MGVLILIMTNLELATPAPQVEQARAFAAPKVDSVQYAATPAPNIEEVNNVLSAIPVKAPRLEPSPPISNIHDNDDEDYDVRLEKNDIKNTRNNNNNSSLSASEIIKHSSFNAYAAIYAPTKKKKRYPWFIRQVLLQINDDRNFISYGEIKRFLIIHEKICYVYLEKISQKPLYIIPLEKYKYVLEEKKD